MLAGWFVRFSTVRMRPGREVHGVDAPSVASSPSLAITRAPDEHDVHRLRDLRRELGRPTGQVVRQDDGERRSSGWTSPPWRRTGPTPA